MAQSDKGNLIYLHIITVYQCYIPYPPCTKQMGKRRKKTDDYQIASVSSQGKSHHPCEGLSIVTLEGFFNVVRNISRGNKKYRSNSFHTGIHYLHMKRRPKKCDK